MKRILIIALLLLCPVARAACYVVRPSSSCSNNGNGANWNCASTSGGSGAFNAVPNPMTRANIYYLADGTYPPYGDDGIADSGTTTAEIRKAIATDNCTSTGWNTSTMGSSQAVFQNNGPGNGVIGLESDYITFNGNGTSTTPGCGGGYGSTVSSSPPTPPDCGIKIDNSPCSSSTANACNNPMYLSNPNTSAGLVGLTFKYVEIEGNGDNNSDQFEVWNPYGGTNTGGTWIHIYAHNAGCVFWQDGLDGVTMNYVRAWGTEVNGATGGCHGQFMFDAGSDSNGTISNSEFRDITGTAIWTFANYSETHNNWLFYNDVIFNSYPAASWSPYLSDGVIACINSGTDCTNFVFVQNDVINIDNPGINNENTGSYTVQNNIYYANANPPAFDTGTGGTYAQSYNSCLNSGTCPSGTANVSDTSAPDPFTNWTAASFTLASENSDWDNRYNLGSPYNTDAAGNTLTTDRGAYQYIPPSGSGAVAPQIELTVQ